MGSYIPNPRHTSVISTAMFEFVGKLMGLSLRFKQALPFTFPSMVWKQMLGLPVDIKDLEVRVHPPCCQAACREVCLSGCGPPGHRRGHC